MSRLTIMLGIVGIFGLPLTLGGCAGALLAAMPNGRCKTHGGRSPGAPRGRQNGNWRGGFYSQESQADRRRLRELIRQMRTAMDEVP